MVIVPSGSDRNPKRKQRMRSFLRKVRKSRQGDRAFSYSYLKPCFSFFFFELEMHEYCMYRKRKVDGCFEMPTSQALAFIFLSSFGGFLFLGRR